MEKTEKNMTGYPSIDRPWLKYYSEEDINTPLPECTMYELIYSKNQKNLRKTAINYYGTNITYGLLFEKINLYASVLENEGIKKGEIVTVCMINSPETIYLLFALNKIGAVANMVCGAETVNELRASICDAHSMRVFTLDLFQDKFLEIADGVGLEQIIVTHLGRSALEEDWSATGKAMKQAILPNDPRFYAWEIFFNKGINYSSTCHDINVPAIITYTGGTTGGSKGAILTNKAAVAFALQYCIGEHGFCRESTWMHILPLFTAYGICGSLMIPLMLGMTLVVRIPLEESLSELWEKFHPNHIMFGPAYWDAFVDENKDFELSNLIAPVSGGDILRPAIETKINQYLKGHGCTYPIINGYGMTEVGAGCTVNFLHAHKIGSVGIPFVKNIVSAFDLTTGNELPYNQEGEICIHTPSAMIEYLNNPKETKNILRMHNDGLLWVHTGDLGYVSEDGFVFISGRMKRFITCVFDGVHKKVFSLDIEKALLNHPGVEKCAVVPIFSELTVQAPVAFIVPRKECNCERELENDIQLFCERVLQPVYRPVQYVFLKEFPLTKVGKVNYLELERMANKI